MQQTIWDVVWFFLTLGGVILAIYIIKDYIRNGQPW